jgi:hypothetical protein
VGLTGRTKKDSLDQKKKKKTLQMRWFRANLYLFSFHKFHPFLKTGKIGKEKKNTTKKNHKQSKSAAANKHPSVCVSSGLPLMSSSRKKLFFSLSRD